VFDVLLGICDEGRLTDPYGRATTFRSCVIIMTSNLGGEQREAFGFSPDRTPLYSHAVREFFRPEFFNRLDAVVSFESLQPRTIEAITRKELGEIAKREGFQRARLRLRWSDRLIKRLAKTGFDARYGARPLQRVLEKEIVAPLAKYLLSDPSLRDGEIEVDCDDEGKIRINPRRIRALSNDFLRAI